MKSGLHIRFGISFGGNPTLGDIHGCLRVLSSRAGGVASRQRSRTIRTCLRPSSGRPTLRGQHIAHVRVRRGALRALGEAQVRVPEEISLISFDDFDFATLMNPPISVISRDARMQGSQAMELMIRQLDCSEAATPEHSMVDVQLVERGSCAPPRGSHNIASNKIDR